MDEVSSYVRLDLLSLRRQGRPKDRSASSSDPMMERPWCRFRREARARERRRLPQVVDSLKVLDQNRPFREADIRYFTLNVNGSVQLPFIGHALEHMATMR